MLEDALRVELRIKVLQTFALPLGYAFMVYEVGLEPTRLSATVSGAVTSAISVTHTGT